MFCRVTDDGGVIRGGIMTNRLVGEAIESINWAFNAAAAAAVAEELLGDELFVLAPAMAVTRLARLAPCLVGGS